MSLQHSFSLARLKINIFTLLKFAGRLSCINPSNIQVTFPSGILSLTISPCVFLISDSSHEIHKSSSSHYSEEALGCDNIVLGILGTM